MKTCNYAVAALFGNVVLNFGAIEHIGLFSSDHKPETDYPHCLLFTMKLNFVIREKFGYFNRRLLFSSLRRKNQRSSRHTASNMSSVPSASPAG